MTEPTIYGIKWEPPTNLPHILTRRDGVWFWQPWCAKELPAALSMGRDISFPERKKIDKTGIL